jgi:predicted nucleic acid-binding protein
VDFFRGVESECTSAVVELVRSGRAACCGIVIAELLAGVRGECEREVLEGALAGLDYFETDVSAWRRVGEMSRELRSRGRAVPTSDLILAAVAVGNGCQLLTQDSHFRRVRGVMLFTPD